MNRSNCYHILYKGGWKINLRGSVENRNEIKGNSSCVRGLAQSEARSKSLHKGLLVALGCERWDILSRHLVDLEDQAAWRDLPGLLEAEFATVRIKIVAQVLNLKRLIQTPTEIDTLAIRNFT